jgi:Tol biopolymer transport system component/DNA-binding winged helix-turn-helix (wHTH) protein
MAVSMTDRPASGVASGVAQRFQFGVFDADLASGELRRSGVRVRIQSQPFKLLAALLEHPGAVVTKEELQQRLWGSDTSVDFDHGLGIAVNKLRDALGDSADNPRFVETLAKRGYRFLAPVKVLDGPESNSLPASGAVETANGTPHSQPAAAGAAVATVRTVKAGLPWAAIAAIALILLMLTVLFLWIFLRQDSRKPYRVSQVTFSDRLLANDMETQSISATAADSTRLYFVNMDNGTPVLSEALIANGEMSRLPLPKGLAAPLILSISPDGSALLVRNHLLPESEEPIWIVPTLGGNARRIPNVEAHDAVWMPDGKRLLLANGNQLQLVNLDGSNLHQVAMLPGPAFWLRWSPDGKTLRYTQRNMASRTTSLWQVSADFQHPSPLLPNWSNPSSECCGSWTSDGKYYVFQSLRSGRDDLWKMRERPWFLRDREPQQVTGGPLDSLAPVAAPQGHRIFFVGENPQIELLVATGKGTGFRFAEHDLRSAAFTKYSRDGKWVAWLNTADGSLWRSRADGSERVELIAAPAKVFNMEWSPDDRQLVLMAEMPGKPWKIYLIDADGGQPRSLIDENRNEADPTWSPDGHSIVFGRLPDRMDSEKQTKAIYEFNLATHKLQELPGSQGLFSPRVSPDGGSIAAVPLDQSALLLFDRQTQRWRTLTTHGVGDPNWSENGKSLYFQDFLEPGKPIYKISIADGKLQQEYTVDSLRTIPVIDYRLISMAPGDQPVISASISTTNVYSIDLD